MPGVAAGLEVQGLRALQRSFAAVSVELDRGLRKELKQFADPIATDVERTAVRDVSGLRRARDPKWSKMRVGVTRRLVYVAEKERGRLSRHNPRLRRPEFGVYLYETAMEPVLRRHEPELAPRLTALIDGISQANGFL